MHYCFCHSSYFQTWWKISSYNPRLVFKKNKMKEKTRRKYQSVLLDFMSLNPKTKNIYSLTLKRQKLKSLIFLQNTNKKLLTIFDIFNNC